MAGFTGTASTGLDMIEETFITFVSSLIVEKISVSLLLISLSIPISVSVSEVDLFGALVGLSSSFPFLVTCTVPCSSRTSRKGIKIGLVARKPVFGVPEKLIFKPACSAIETS